MNDKIIRLDCLRIANGDVKKAQEMYDFIMAKPTKKRK